MNNDDFYWATGLALAALCALFATALWVIFEGWR